MSLPSKFEPLNPAASEIRLLRLLPGTADEPIRCTLHIVSLDKPPRYEAISYVCGDPADTRTIFVNGQRHEVTVNLEDALRGLRRRRRSRQLWADAICINQDNIEEKNKQVPEMARIYAQASRVLVWLGEPALNVRVAVSWAQRYRRIKPFLHHTKLKFMSLLSTTAMEDYLEERERAAFGFVEVFAHRYWSRMWTYQEYMLARGTPLLVWKGLHIPSYVLRTRGSATAEKLEARTGEFAPEISDILTTNLVTGETLGEGSTVRQSPFTTTSSFVQALWLLQSGPLDVGSANLRSMHVLTRTIGRTCSDPRDMVYALYGFIPALSRAYPPDYSKSVEQVMHDTAIYLAGTGGLWIHVFYSLYENRPCTGSDSTITTPSWVLDLTRPSLRSLLNASHYSPHQFHCHSSMSDQLVSSTKLKVSPTGRILRLPVRELGDLHCVVRFSSDVDPILHQLIDLFALLSDRDPAIFDAQPWQNIRAQARSNLNDRLARVLLDVDMVIPIARSGDEFLKDLYRLQESLRMTDAKLPATVDDLDLDHELWRVENLLLELRSKAVFVTMGCIGMTVGDVGEHDEIVISKGLVQPAVLRSMRSEESDAEEFKLVGFAYVDGMMDNEFEDPELVSEVLQLERRIYNVC